MCMECLTRIWFPPSVETMRPEGPVAGATARRCRTESCYPAMVAPSWPSLVPPSPADAAVMFSGEGSPTVALGDAAGACRCRTRVLRRGLCHCAVVNVVPLHRR